MRAASISWTLVARLFWRRGRLGHGLEVELWQANAAPIIPIALQSFRVLVADAQARGVYGFAASTWGIG